MLTFRVSSIAISLITLVACGGGGDGSPTPPPANPPPVTTQPPVPPPPPPAPTTFSISGSIATATNTVVDSDVNDPVSDYTDNSGFDRAQPVNNFVVIQGYATQSATGNPGDTFANFGDSDDFYSASLQAGQLIQLQVVDYNGLAIGRPFEGDLDMALYDENFALISFSETVTEFEEIIVPADGRYYLHIYTFSGASKYVVNLLSGSAGGPLRAQSMDFVLDQAIVKTSDEEKGKEDLKAAMASAFTVSHSQSDRAALTRFDTQRLVAANTQANTSLNDSQQLSLRKLETLKQIKRLRLSPGVEYADPNYIVQPQLVPNDEFYQFQWHYPAINLPQAWDITTGTPAAGDVIVAVIDTGVVLSHPDLSNKLVPGFDFISDPNFSLDGDGIDNNPDDPGDEQVLGQSSWHGTHVAGTIAAETSTNGFGVAGVSWGAKIMPMRVLGADGGTVYDILQAVRFAAGLSNDSGQLPAQRADVLNLSLGGVRPPAAAEEETYQEVIDSGVLVVAAAGNSNVNELNYPAAFPSVISVSATDFDNNKAPYSNFGSTINIAAPGGDVSVDRNGDGVSDGVLSTVIDDTSGQRNPIYGTQQGTSMATPHIAGVLALMKAVHPGLTPQDVDTLLVAGELTQDAGAPGRDDIFGHGIIDALKAVQAAQQLAGGGGSPPPQPAIVASPTAINLGSSTSAEVTLTNQGGGSPAFIGLSSDVTWLVVSSNTVDAQGLGVYTLSVDRTGLVDGTYTGTLAFNFDSPLSVQIGISMTVGSFSTDGDLGQLFVLLVEPGASGPSTTVIPTQSSAGLYDFIFTNVAPGDYLIAAGTDIDNDDIVCEFGEGCGVYPSFVDAVTINFDGSGNVSNIDFVAEILAGFRTSTNQSTSTDGTAGTSIPTGFELQRERKLDKKRR